MAQFNNLNLILRGNAMDGKGILKYRAFNIRTGRKGNSVAFSGYEELCVELS